MLDMLRYRFSLIRVPCWCLQALHRQRLRTCARAHTHRVCVCVCVWVCGWVGGRGGGKDRHSHVDAQEGGHEDTQTHRHTEKP